MTNRTQANLTAQLASDIPDNTTQDISASELRSAATDLNDTIFRENAIALSDDSGRILLQQGGYLLRGFTATAYETTGTRFGDGTDYFTRTDWLPADGGDMTMIMSIKHDAISSTQTFYYGGNVGSSQHVMALDATNNPDRRFEITRLNQTALVGTAQNASSLFDRSIIESWMSLAIIIKAAGGHEVWQNGVEITTNATLAGTIDWTGTAWFGDWSAGFNSALWAEVSHLWISSEYVDISADYNKFFDANNKPIDLGSDGSTPTGTQPAHFAPDGDLRNNLGTESNWTGVGTLAASSTSPTD